LTELPFVAEPPLEVDRTPVEWHGGYAVKRDDLFNVGGSRGGKVRTCLALAERATAEGRRGLVTAGARHSPQVNIVATVAAQLGLRCRAHIPAGPMTPELEAAAAAGAQLIAHRPGHNSVIIARARADAATLGWAHIPFGMEHAEAVRQTAGQVGWAAASASRIVVAVGSGMSAAGIVAGLHAARSQTRVLGVCVGADPRPRLNKFCAGWRARLDLAPAALPYNKPHSEPQLGGLPLDPYYEAKCLPHLQAGDLFWVVGIRATAGGTVSAQEFAANTASAK